MAENTKKLSSRWPGIAWPKSVAISGLRILDRCAMYIYWGLAAVLAIGVCVLLLIPDVFRFRRRQSTTPPPAPKAKPAQTKPMSALDKQVGGSHYKDMAIQPMTYSMANGLDPCQHTIIKYVTRFRKKGGIQDLEKARHTLDLLIEFERERVK